MKLNKWDTIEGAYFVRTDLERARLMCPDFNRGHGRGTSNSDYIEKTAQVYLEHEARCKRAGIAPMRKKDLAMIKGVPEGTLNTKISVLESQSLL